ncbi:MAG: class I SAM-dependent methyltransferase [Bdellovibrio sp.]|nr:class I SAM-dependent methyltransferase [Bdellovibrio sp.]
MKTSADPNYNWRIRTWYPNLGQETHVVLESFYQELIQYNKTASIIASKVILNADLVYFANSIESSKIVREKLNKNIELYSFGGAIGLPGLIYGILYRDQKVILIEPDERRFKFLEGVVRTLELSNVSVANKKVETMPHDCFTQAICRDFMPLPRALLTLRKLVRQGGVVFHIKSDEWSLEISEIPSQLCSSWLPGLESKYELPAGDTRLFVVRTDKI